MTREGRFTKDKFGYDMPVDAPLFAKPPIFYRYAEAIAVYYETDQEAALDLLPEGWPAAFEFRHESWFDEDVYEALRSRDAALCVADTDDGETPFVVTGKTGYVRLRREAYDDDALHEWATRITSQPWEQAFVFFKHEDAGAGPARGRPVGGLLARGATTKLCGPKERKG